MTWHLQELPVSLRADRNRCKLGTTILIAPSRKKPLWFEWSCRRLSLAKSREKADFSIRKAMPHIRNIAATRHFHQSRPIRRPQNPYSGKQIGWSDGSSIMVHSIVRKAPRSVAGRGGQSASLSRARPDRCGRSWRRDGTAGGKSVQRHLGPSIQLTRLRRIPLVTGSTRCWRKEGKISRLPLGAKVAPGCCTPKNSKAPPS